MAHSTTANSQPEATTADIRSQISTIGEDLRELAQQVRGLARGSLRSARDSAGEAYEAGKDKVRDLEQDLEGYVRSRPLKSLLIALCAGAVVGFLTRRR